MRFFFIYNLTIFSLFFSFSNLLVLPTVFWILVIVIFFLINYIYFIGLFWLYFDFFYVLFLAEPFKLLIFSHNKCFHFRLNLKQNKKNLIFFFEKNILITSEPTPMCNVKIIVDQLQCTSVYKEPVLISENHSLLFFVLFQSLSNINNASL